MPTRLGNILRSAERHGERYGLDSVTTWPRLYVVLPEQFKTSFAAAASALEAMAITSALGVAFAIIGGLLGAVILPWYGAALRFWLGMLVARLGYRGMLRAAIPYASLVRTAFDVHRFELLTAMKLRLPTSYGTERRQWDQLRKLWSHGAPDSNRAADLRYPDGKDGPPPEPVAESPRTTVGGNPTSVRRVLPALVLLAGLVLPAFAAVREDNWLLIPGTGPLPQATRHIDAYHVITRADVTTTGTPTSLTDVIGRYTLRPIEKDDPLDIADLGPRLPTDALTDRTIMVVTPTRPAGLADRLARGQHVTLFSADKRPTDALILEVTQIDPTRSSSPFPPPAPPLSVRTMYSLPSPNDFGAVTVPPNWTEVNAHAGLGFAQVGQSGRGGDAGYHATWPV